MRGKYLLLKKCNIQSHVRNKYHLGYIFIFFRARIVRLPFGMSPLSGRSYLRD